MGEMIAVSHNLTEVLSSSLENVVVFCGRVLPPLWFIPTQMGISLCVV